MCIPSGTLLHRDPKVSPNAYKFEGFNMWWGEKSVENDLEWFQKCSPISWTDEDMIDFGKKVLHHYSSPRPETDMETFFFQWSNTLI